MGMRACSHKWEKNSINIIIENDWIFIVSLYYITKLSVLALWTYTLIMIFHVGFFERSRSISDRKTGESIKLCSLPDPQCFTLSLYLPSSELSFIWQFENFLQKLKKLHQTRLTLYRWKWIYSWNGRLFPSWMFIIPLYIKSSQDLCANGFSLVVAAFEL